MNNPFTSPDVGGVSTRYALTALSWVFVAVAVYQGLPVETQTTLREFVGPWGALLALIPAIATPLYAVLTKARSDKAQEASVAVDRGLKEGDITKSTPISIKTPEGKPDLPVAQPK